MAFVALPMALMASVRAEVPQGVETFDLAWRTVRDSHFDKTLNGVNWDAVNAELRPKAVAARTVGELRAVMGRTFARDKIVEAHRHADTGHKVGNLVVVIVGATQ